MNADKLLELFGTWYRNCGIALIISLGSMILFSVLSYSATDVGIITASSILDVITKISFGIFIISGVMFIYKTFILEN